MSNKQRYKQAFSAIHISDEFSLEVKEMKTAPHKPKFTRFVACAAACAAIAATATAAYAADFCGIQRTVQLWIHGDQTNVTIDFDGNGSYTFDYVAEDGTTSTRGGGGIAIEDDGTERPLRPDELLEELTTPEVAYLPDGSVWVYWFDQKIDITDKFEDDICYVKLVNGDETLYMTVKYQIASAASPEGYPSPSEFNN